MKRLSWLYVILMFVGCTESSIEDNFVIGEGSEEFYASIESANSRTYVDEQIRMRWHAEDRITIFKKETYNREFKFTGKTGANAGGFTQVSEDDDFYFGYAVNANYAVYPHSTDTELDETDCFFTLTMPAEQSYAENTFGQNANTMVAVSETGNLMFKNVGCYLRVRLYGENTNISSVTLTTKGDEAIAGEAKVTPSMDGNPTCEMTGTGKSIRLICETPVAISSNADAPTDFWIVVPPVTLADGFSVTVKDENDNAQVYDVNQSFTFERNKYYDMVREVEIEDIKTVHVEEAGTLSSLIPDEDKSTITSLKLLGELNGTDIKFLRENMLGCTADKLGSLKKLDLSEVSIVEGGESYITQNNIVGNYMFIVCETLEDVTLPQNITAIGDAAFQGCQNLSKITIFEGVQSIGKYAFSDCNLSEIIIPNGVETIGEGAFVRNYNLNSVTIPQSVTAIEISAFGYHEDVVDIYIQDLYGFMKAMPTSVMSLRSDNYRLYLNNVEVNELVIPEDFTIQTNWGGCLSFTSVTFLEGFDTGSQLKTGAFRYCTNLRQATLPNSSTNIPSEAFADSGLTEVTIGNNVATISYEAFLNCPLETFYCYSPIPPTIDYIPSNHYIPEERKSSFKGVNMENATLYVPKGCKAAYEASDWANYFGTIVEMN